MEKEDYFLIFKKKI